ncbi:T9SS type A sorting domain-containing protein [Lacibacter sediminis]|uniref:T9SS type A sorting domain-containing protein n=1 Tax=Lacibacter sediminis TaxID=2760713 RepID=A0A7G5XKV1_9BACT|nr:T9SS type A sorting domain-containing protein [Lacibacter sediminis]QNA46104.1 T9SS type A sorting domain-containing protein [Lacibacter sediminis]
MKRFYLLVIFLDCFFFGQGQINFITTVFYNSSNNTITVQVGLRRENPQNCAGVIAIAEIDFEMQWSADVRLQSSQFIPSGGKLDIFTDNLSGSNADNGHPNPYPGTNGSRPSTIDGETYQTFDFHRSTNLCANTIQIECGQIVPLFSATFELTTPANANQYSFTYDNVTPANNSNYIVEFNNGTASPSNNKKEILFVTDKTKSISDLSGNNCNSDGTIKNTSTTSLVGNPAYTNTYGAILPAAINLFDVKRHGTQTILSWSTSAEELNKGFEIQRKINSQFETIGFIDSKATQGFSSQILNYTFTDDEQYPAKTVYYRLKLIGFNGQEVYSEVRVMRNAGKLQTLIYPNPSAGNLQIVLPQNTGANTIELTDYSGKRIRVWEKYNAPVLNIGNLPKGFFTFTITNLQTSERTVEKIIVQ